MNPTNRKALVIGINRYPELNDGHLKVSADDAEAIAQLLGTYGHFHPIYRFPEGFLQDRGDLYPCVAPTHDLNNFTTEDLKTAIEKLFKPQTDIPHTALLFFAGHGLFNDNGKLVLATSEAGYPNQEWGISLEWLCGLLKDSPVKQQIVWLDCCYSGEWIELAKTQLHNSDKQLFFITATTSYESAFADDKHGILTKIILEGLDPSKDSYEGLITHTKLERFIKTNPPKIAQKILVYSSSNSEIHLTCTEKYKLRSLILESNYERSQTQPTNQKSDVPSNNSTAGSDIKILYNALTKLDYSKQEGRFWEFVETNQVVACLIHGQSEQGQRWLLNRLIKRIPGIKTNDCTPPFSFLKKTQNGSLNSLWKDIERKLHLNTKPIPSEIVKAIYRRSQKETVVLIFNNIDDIEQTYLQQFLKDFWEPLVNLACSSLPKSYEYRLLMFLIDCSGEVEKWNIPWVDNLDTNWHPRNPIKLQKIQHLTPMEVGYWLSQTSDLPSQLNQYIQASTIEKTVEYILETSGGLHEEALYHICKLCNCDWSTQESLNHYG